MESPPKPSWLLVISAVLVMAESVLWIAIGLAGCFTGDVISFFGALFLGPLAAIIGFLQYSALTRRNPTTARRIGFILAALSAFWTFGLLANFGEGIQQGIEVDPDRWTRKWVVFVRV